MKRKLSFKQILLLFTVIMAVSVSCLMSVSAAVNPTVSVNTTERNLLVGQYMNLGAKASYGAALKFKSGNTNIVAVNSNGTIKGKKNGAAWVYVWATKGTARSAVEKVLVVVGKSQPISIKKNSVGVTGKVNAGASSVGKRTYKSSNTGIFTVDAYGNITGKKAGTATLTVTAARGKSGGYFYVKTSKAFKITVLRNGQTISVQNSTITNKPGTKMNLGASSKTQRSYGSSNSNVCAVDAYGNLTFKNPGSAVISIWAAGTNVYKSASAKVTVNVTGFDQTVNVSQTAYTLTMGENAKITASAQTPLTYSSSDTSIVTVDAAGNIYAKERQEEGDKKVTITVTAAKTEKYASAKATITVTVRPNGHFEQRLVRDAWTETIQHDEEFYYVATDKWISVYMCSCGAKFNTTEELSAHKKELESGLVTDEDWINYLEVHAGDSSWSENVQKKVVYKEAYTEEIYHEAEYVKEWVLNDGSGIVSSAAAMAESPDVIVFDEVNSPDMTVTDESADIMTPDESAVPGLAVYEDSVAPEAVILEEDFIPDADILEEEVIPDVVVSEENVVPDIVITEDPSVSDEIILDEVN